MSHLTVLPKGRITVACERIMLLISTKFSFGMLGVWRYCAQSERSCKEREREKSAQGIFPTNGHLNLYDWTISSLVLSKAFPLGKNKILVGILRSLFVLCVYIQRREWREQPTYSQIYLTTRSNKGKGINNEHQKEADVYVRVARLFTA